MAPMGKQSRAQPERNFPRAVMPITPVNTIDMHKYTGVCRERLYLRHFQLGNYMLVYNVHWSLGNVLNLIAGLQTVARLLCSSSDHVSEKISDTKHAHNLWRHASGSAASLCSSIPPPIEFCYTFPAELDDLRRRIGGIVCSHNSFRH